MIHPGKMFVEVLTHLFRKPATEAYPFGPSTAPEGIRGMIEFFAEKCVGCRLCMKDCPSDAITITKVGDKKFEATFNLDSCMYCAQCVDSCNKGALASSSKYELAQLDKSRLRITFSVKEKETAPADESAAPVEPAQGA